jgi:hypothetical protein
MLGIFCSRLRDYRVSVLLRVPIGDRFVPNMGIGQPSVTHYQGELDNTIMQGERPGDRVQVCLMSFPTPTYNAQMHRFVCDPDRDPRGYVFRVYDYRHGRHIMGLVASTCAAVREIETPS